jgi:transcription elongation factor GreA
MQTILLSKKGFKELHKEIAGLESEEKSIIAELKEIGRAKSRDEKLQRSEALMNLENIQSKLSIKREALKTAKPLPRKRDRLRVAIGSVVDLVDQQGKIFRYTIVNSLEANPSDGRISIDSPLGQSLLNRQTSETVSWSSGMQVRQLQLIDIR